jgi:hypothetical protein
MSERTDTKLLETKFFFQSLVRESDKESPSEPDAFLFYLNAFVTAGANPKSSHSLGRAGGDLSKQG